MNPCWIDIFVAVFGQNTFFICEFWFLFLHILNGRMATLPQTLPRSFRDLHFCFRESKFKTRASASFRAVDFFSISLEVLPRSHRELPRKLFLGVAWKCVICICWWAGHSDNVFGCTGWRVKNTYYIKVILFKWARGLSMPLRERFASAKLPRSFRKEHEHFYQKHTKIMATLCSPQLM